jgi:hypothetical protein
MSVDPHEINNEDPILEINEKEQAVLDRLKDEATEDDNSNVDLPSNKDAGSEDNGSEDKVYAGKYKSVDALKDGVKNINPDVPDYILNGLTDEALEQYYIDQQKNFSSPDKSRKHGKEEREEEREEEARPEEVGSLWEDLEREYRENSEISDETYDKMNAAGIPDNIIDKFADNLQKEQVEFTNKVLDISGGIDNFNTMKEWAEAGNIAPAELDAIGELPYDAMLGALEGIKARYEKAVGANTDTTVRLTGSQNANSSSYRNQSEYILDVSDRRYGSDKKYTAAVDNKFANSSISK